MKDEAAKAFHDQLVCIAEERATASEGTERFGQVDYESPAFNFYTSNVSGFDSFVEKVAQRWPEVSRFLVEDAVAECVAIIRKDGSTEATIAAVRKIFEDLEGIPHAHAVYVPVVGLSLEAQEIQAGPIAIVKLSTAEIERFWTAID